MKSAKVFYYVAFALFIALFLYVIKVSSLSFLFFLKSITNVKLQTKVKYRLNIVSFTVLCIA